MEKIEKQRLEQLVRLGIVPSNKLPILVQGLENLSMGKQLLPNEREVISKYMDNLTSIMLNDTTVFNRAKLHTQKSKYQAEEITVNNGVKIFDNPEEEEQHRKQTERKLRVRAADKKERFKLLPAAVKKEKRKAGLDEDLLAINNTYQAVFEAALELYGVTNIRDLPEDKKAEFFIVVDSASSDNDLSDIEEDMKVKQAVGIASDKRYKKGNMTGAVNAIEKLKPGLSDHPQVKAVLKRQNENVETDIEQLDESFKVIATHGKVEVRSHPGDSEGNHISIHKNGKEVASGDYDFYADSYFISHPSLGKGQKPFNSAKSIAHHFSTMKEEIELDEGHQVVAKTKQGETFKSAVYPTKEKAMAMHWKLSKNNKYANVDTVKVQKEEVDQIDELKIGTLVRYASKAGKSALSKGIESGRARDMGDDDKAAALKQKSDKRYAGQKQAIGKINNRFKSGVNVGEEVELDEELHGYKLKLTKTTHPHVEDDQDNPVKAIEKHYDVHLNNKKVGEIKHHYNDHWGHTYGANLHGKNVPYGRTKDDEGDGAHNFMKSIVKTKFYSNLKKEDVQLDEGRPSQQHPLEGHAYHKKSNAELEYIAKDAHEAAEAMKSHNTTAENKYRDQANDSATVRNFRKKNGTPDWYKKKYGLKEEVESVNELVGNQHKIDANKNGKVDAHDFKLLRSKKKQPQGADFAAQRRKERLASSGRMDERYGDDDYGSMSKRDFKRREMEHELGGEGGAKRKSSNSNTKVQGSPLLPGIRPYSGFKKEETELTFEEMTPAQKAERLRMIARAADRVHSGAAEKSVKKLAKRDMKSPGAQRGMAPLKKDVDEQIQILRKTIVEGTAREKIDAYKELNNLIQEKLKGEEQ